MKDLSFFLLKNALGAKMRKGFKNFCHGDASTSTLNQHKRDDSCGEPSACFATRSLLSVDENPYTDDEARGRGGQPTLEEMILRLELEEKMARRGKVLDDDDDDDDDYGGEIKHRMSCVNSSDILRTARNALNQYPRFSLDGKDAMYRSSFRNNMPPAISTSSRKSSCGSNGPIRKGIIYNKDCFDSEVDQRIRHLPTRLGGERVVWCKPGVVAKLMGLDAMPIPLYRNHHHHHHHHHHHRHGKERLSDIIKRQNLWRRAERHELERRLVLNAATRCGGARGRGMMTGGSCSSRSSGYCVMKPIAVELANNEDAGWPMRHFL